jgi:hypothetical protein
MAGSIREVGAPEVTPPQHTMSEVGAARLAALSPADKQLPTEEGPEQQPNVVRDAEGNVADLTTDELTLAPKPDGQAERTTPASEVDVSIIPELPVSAPYQEEMQAYRGDVAQIAAEYPGLKSEAAVLFEYIGTAAAAELAKATADGDWQQGQTVGPDLRNPDQCRQVLRMRFGESMADGLMDQAAKEFAKLPENVRGWIDADMDGTGRRIGNHPDLVVGLALRAFAQLSPAAAQKELAMVRHSPAYLQGDKLQIAKAHMLQIVVGHAQAKTQDTRSVGKQTPPSMRKDFAVQPQAASLQKQIDSLRRDPAYFDRYHAAHKEVVAQVQTLYRKLYAEDK